MKKLILCLTAGLISSFSFSQTATNFNVNDCASVNHDLFTELNSGKVIVLCWVMPCGACSGPASSAYNIVQTYTASNPGQVLFYLVDDIGDISCASLNNWANSNGMPNGPRFSNPAIDMNDYGGAGMPKTVVLGGGSSHTVYFNQNNALNTTNFTNAINTATAASTGINEVTSANYKTSISPNPATNEVTVSFELKQNENVSVEIYNLVGQKVKTLDASAVKGKNDLKVNLEGLSNGNYFLKLNNGKSTDTLKLLISK